MPLDEAPNLVSMLGALERAVIGELYERLTRAGYSDLAPASAPVFQFARPGGSTVAEIARLGQLSEEATLQQARLLETGGYTHVREGSEPGDATVALSERGQAVASLGGQVLQDVEARWRETLGPRDFDAFYATAARLTLVDRR